MIAISIVSGLVLALFTLKFESPDDRRQAKQGKRRAIKCELGALVRNA